MAGERSGLTAVSSLEDPVRARLYRIVAESDAPVGRDEAAAAAGIGRALAAYHLDRLPAAGPPPPRHPPPGGGGGARSRPRPAREGVLPLGPRVRGLGAAARIGAGRPPAGGRGGG